MRRHPVRRENVPEYSAMLGSQTGTWCVSQSLLHSLSRRQRKHGFLHTRTITQPSPRWWSLVVDQIRVNVPSASPRVRAASEKSGSAATVTSVHQVIIAVGLGFFQSDFCESAQWVERSGAVGGGCGRRLRRVLFLPPTERDY